MVRMRPRRKARYLPPANCRTGPPRPTKARFRGSPCSSRDAKAARARRVPPQALGHRGQALHWESCAAIRVSAINAICAKVAPRHQTRPVPRLARRALRRVHSAMKAQGMCAERSPGVISATCGKAGPEPPHQMPRTRPVKRGVFHRPELPANADRAMRRRPAESSSAAGGKGAALRSATGAVGGRGIFLGAKAPTPVGRRQAAVSAAASANCATARRRERLLRKSRAAANGQESKVRAREIRVSAASAGHSSAPLRPCRPSVLRRWSAVRLQALRPHDRALLPRRGRDHNRPQPPARHLREEVARPPEAITGARNGRPSTACFAGDRQRSPMRLQHRKCGGNDDPRRIAARYSAVVFASRIKIGAVGSEIGSVGAASSLSCGL
jgi:hypothetical protein